ncbi:hypothetical protein ACTFIY_004283 [Dictyostelium cf. discoideum]
MGEGNQLHLKFFFQDDPSISTIRDKLLNIGIIASNKQIQYQLIRQGLKVKKEFKKSTNVTKSLVVKILSKYFNATRTESSCKKQFSKDKSIKKGSDLVDYTDENEKELIEGISLQPDCN